MPDGSPTLSDRSHDDDLLYTSPYESAIDNQDVDVKAVDTDAEFEDLLRWTAQQSRGSIDEVITAYDGFDTEKKLAFISAHAENLKSVRPLILRVLLTDEDKEVQAALSKVENISEVRALANRLFREDAQKFSKEIETNPNVLRDQERGRQWALGHIMEAGRREKLTKGEIKHVKQLAEHTYTKEFVAAALETAKVHSFVYLPLLKNRSLEWQDMKQLVADVEQSDHVSDKEKVAIFLETSMNLFEYFPGEYEKAFRELRKLSPEFDRVTLDHGIEFGGDEGGVASGSLKPKRLAVSPAPKKPKKAKVLRQKRKERRVAKKKSKAQKRQDVLEANPQVVSTPFQNVAEAQKHEAQKKRKHAKKAKKGIKPQDGNF